MNNNNFQYFKMTDDQFACFLIFLAGIFSLESLEYLELFDWLNFFLKIFQVNSFHLFYDLNQSVSFALVLIFFIILLAFPQILIYLSKTFSSFIMKHTHSISAKSIIYALAFGKNMHQSRIFLSYLQPMKYLKSHLPRRTFLHATICLLSISVIKIEHLF